MRAWQRFLSATNLENMVVCLRESSFNMFYRDVLWAVLYKELVDAYWGRGHLSDNHFLVSFNGLILTSPLEMTRTLSLCFRLWYRSHPGGIVTA